MKVAEGANEIRCKALVFRYNLHLRQVLALISSSSSKVLELLLKLTPKFWLYFSKTLLSSFHDVLPAFPLEFQKYMSLEAKSGDEGG
jgi:hypothetical protein